MKKQEMSIDELAAMINKSFNHVEERLDRLEQGQKEIKQELTFSVRKFEVTDLTSRVEKLEYDMAKMSK